MVQIRMEQDSYLVLADLADGNEALRNRVAERNYTIRRDCLSQQPPINQRMMIAGMRIGVVNYGNVLNASPVDGRGNQRR